MESNINHQRIKNYSSSFAAKLIETFFSDRHQIKGAEIPTFSPIKQVNYFILKLLFEEWHGEFEKLKSPYFDYNNVEVEQAMKSFMNVLSKNILIEKEDFGPLLEGAVYKTILLIYSPYEYFLQEINQSDAQQITIEELQSKQKYVKINTHLLNAYIDKFHEDGIQAIFKEDAVKIFDEVCETIKETPDDFDSYQQAFSEVLPLDLNEVYSDSENPSKSMENNSNDHEPNNINTAFSSQNNTLLDTLGGEPYEAIGSIHEKTSTEPLRKMISINQRFMFENDLFSGDKKEFEMVLNYLDNCKSHQEAMDFIHENYTKKKSWDVEKEEVLEFFEVLNKRFPL